MTFVKLKSASTVTMVCLNGLQVVPNVEPFSSLLIDMRETCYENEVRFGNDNNRQPYAFGVFNNQTDFRTGYMEICINGSFHLLCNENLDVETASSLCNRSPFGYNLGYPGAVYGSDSDFLLPGTSTGVYNINCPDRYFDLYSCSYTTVTNSSNGCNANDGPALVTCVDGKYV